MHFASWDEVKRREWFARLVQDAGKQAREGYNWAITLRSNGMLIGWFFIGGPPRDRGCGYALDRRFWGQGYMPEAARAIFAYEFTVLGTLRMFAECETPNTASARVMQKSGMLYEETSYNADFEGNWATRHRYAISKQDWEAVSRAEKQRSITSIEDEAAASSSIEVIERCSASG